MIAQAFDTRFEDCQIPGFTTVGLMTLALGLAPTPRGSA